MLDKLLTPVAGLVVLVILILLLIASRYKVAGPNDAFIVTGRKGKKVRNPETGEVSSDLSGQRVVMGGGVFVIPFIQRLFVMDLSSRRIMVQIRGAVSGQGIKLNLDGVAIVKVGGSEDSIRAAAQRFLTQQDEIEVFTQETLAGSLRSIVGGLTVEEIIRDRAAFAQRVAEESEASLTGQGLVLDTFQIQDITDDGTYLSDLGRPEAARILQVAAIAEAQAKQEAEQARISAEQNVAVRERELQLKKSEIKAETDAAAAKAAASGPLAQAERDQQIYAEQEKVAVAQASLKDRQLDTEIRKPADAARYEVETEAEGRKKSAILEAEASKLASIAKAQAQAETLRLTGEGEKAQRVAQAQALKAEGEAKAEILRLTGEGEKARRIAEAEALKAEGDAEASKVLAIGQAEADAMTKKADAYNLYNEAAVIEMMINVLPQVAEKIAEPMASIDKLTVISPDGAGTMTKQVTSGLAQAVQILKDTTGFDISQMVPKYQTKQNSENKLASENS